MKVLVATVKPFSKEAVAEIKKVVEGAGYEFALLEKYEDVAQFKEAVKDADALIVRSDKVTPEIVEAGDKLKIVVRAGAGYDNVDLAKCTEKKIVVMNTPGQNSNAVAELAVGLMISVSRNCFTPGTGSELKGKTLGIHAYGNVGKLVAKCGKALGMTVYAFDPFIKDHAVYEKDGVIPAESVEDLYVKSKFVSLHMPANEQTKNSINYDLLSKMPKGATLINTARKEVVDEESLKKIFAERADFRYATDVAPACAEELKKEYPSRFFATPKKMGAETAEANMNAGIAAANQIVGFFKEGITKFQVNK